jgi:hypothetical protein
VLPVWAGECLRRSNLSVSCFPVLEILGRCEGCANKKADARGSFSRGPKNFDDGNDATGSAALKLDR